MRKNITAFEKESAHGLFLATGIHGEVSNLSRLDLSFNPNISLGFPKMLCMKKDAPKLLCFKHVKFPLSASASYKLVRAFPVIGHIGCRTSKGFINST